MNQVGHHEPAGEGTMCGVVYQNEIGYNGPKTFQKTLPSILAWYKQFKGPGNILHKEGTGRPRVSDENIERISRFFVRLCLYAYKLRVV